MDLLRFLMIQGLNADCARLEQPLNVGLDLGHVSLHVVSLSALLGRPGKLFSIMSKFDMSRVKCF